MDKHLFIFDLDGTLALNQHRQHLLETTPRQWDAWNKACVGDSPNKPLVTIMRLLQAQGEPIYILTGRDAAVRFETEQWMRRHGVPDVPMFMRSVGDHTEDVQLKMRWFEIIRQDFPGWPVVVFDDRTRTVNAWREAGAQCWQVAKGDF